MDIVVAEVIGDIALVLVVSSLPGAVSRRCGQPAVIGQILTGLLFGPSLLGRLPGHLTNHLFPHQVLSYLTALSQVAVVIFMFAVGNEIEFRASPGRGRAVPLVAASALLVPMGLGVACVLVFRPSFAAIGRQDDSRSFLLFMGVATSITALPVLAAIVREGGLAGTTAGVIATAAAGIMEVLAGLVLAAALIGTGYAQKLPWPAALLLISAFVAVMLLAVRPALPWWTSRSRSLLSNPVPVAFALAMGSAWITASLGPHPVFGGFLGGLTMRARNRAPDAEALRVHGSGWEPAAPALLRHRAVAQCRRGARRRADPAGRDLHYRQRRQTGTCLCDLPSVRAGTVSVRHHRHTGKYEGIDRAGRAQRRAGRWPHRPGAIYDPCLDGIDHYPHDWAVPVANSSFNAQQSAAVEQLINT